MASNDHKTRQEMDMLIEAMFSRIIVQVDSPSFKVRSKTCISRFIEDLEMGIKLLKTLVMVVKMGLYEISELLTEFPAFTRNWAIATCYLTAMEIAVNNKLKDLGLDIGESSKDKQESFKDKYRKLLEKLVEKGIEMGELEKSLPINFWDIRHKVVHAGYSPTDYELETIITYVKKFLKKLQSL